MSDITVAMIIRLCLTLLLFVVSFGGAYAQEKNTAPSESVISEDTEKSQNNFGISMHGTPKYSRADTHVDYANPDAPKGGTLKQAAIGTFDTLNPYSIKGKAALGLNLVYDRLMARVWDEPFTMYPLIAERYEMPEDRSSITFDLNPAARFHDGSPITTDDVLFSFETLKDEGRPNMRNVYRLVDRTEKLGENGIRFTFKDGYDRETALIIAMMPVLSKSWWDGRVFDSTILETPNLNGPYTVESIDPGRSITYKRKNDYWAKDLLANKGHYNFDQITYDYYRDDTIAFESFKAGDLNFRREFDVGKWASSYNFPAIENNSVVKTALPHQRPEKARGFIFNTRRPPFDDIAVRQALSLLFNYDWVNKNLYHGLYTPIQSYFPNSELAYDTHHLSPDQALDLRTRMREASALLKKSGWAIQNGVQTKNGLPLSFEILINAPEEEKIALNFKKTLERLGIQARIRVMDTAAFLGRLNVYDYDMVSYYWQSSLSPGTEQILYWGCAAANEPSRWNYPGICDPEIDALAESVPRTKDRESLIKTMRELDHKLQEGHYMIPLFYNGQDYFSYSAAIKHPENTPIYGAVIETWWMDQ